MQATRSFEPETDQVRVARHFTADFLRGQGLECPDVLLMVSELATNAVLHARSDFVVTVTIDGYRIRVEVSDSNSRLPSVTVVPDDAYSGRGLKLVQALSAAWGVGSYPDSGKTIWFEVPVAGD